MARYIGIFIALLCQCCSVTSEHARVGNDLTMKCDYGSSTPTQVEWKIEKVILISVNTTHEFVNPAYAGRISADLGSGNFTLSKIKLDDEAQYECIYYLPIPVSRSFTVNVSQPLGSEQIQYDVEPIPQELDPCSVLTLSSRTDVCTVTCTARTKPATRIELVNPEGNTVESQCEEESGLSKCSVTASFLPPGENGTVTCEYSYTDPEGDLALTRCTIVSSASTMEIYARCIAVFVILVASIVH